MLPWANQHEIAADTGLTPDEVATRLDRLRNRWAKSVPALTPMRDDVSRMLEDHGRILEWRQLAAALLARRGSGLEDAAARMILASLHTRGDRNRGAQAGAKPGDTAPGAEDAGRADPRG